MTIDEFYGKRQQMVDTQIVKRGIKDKRVIEAMRKVPRHLFIDNALWPQAYEDHPLPIGEKQTISQPYIVALMTEALELEENDKVLEIGTGSGYQTAILAELAEQVYSIERLPNIAKNARKILDKLNYKNVMISIRDGTEGWSEFAPFDAIIVTAAAPHIPRPLFEQLKIKGRLVIPIGGEFSQDLMVYTKTDKEATDVENLGGCRFVKLIGAHGWKE
ncbi:MAG TPA: protein-L-isoaspartate(D-aspartate) O-methyltransferase [Syntrophorhabdaceae bacterium]|nr:protein-L-isoaspartate(D-aspartate) O-methyltransferase [Syntrophorhabdaceae bacterium]HPU30510.1 protein-L-isoaspartate(D-aspartate) O-methyltransferase [Syntrophorhabdaceae bacterium]